MFKLFNIFNRPTPESKAKDQLYRARMELLDAQAAKDHYDGICLSMQATIDRLEEYLGLGESREEVDKRLDEHRVLWKASMIPSHPNCRSSSKPVDEAKVRPDLADTSAFPMPTGESFTSAEFARYQAHKAIKEQGDIADKESFPTC